MKFLLSEVGGKVSITSFLDEADLFTAATQNPQSKIYDQSELPDVEFMGAWTINGDIDIEKAKEVWCNKIRVIRNARLKTLDLEWMKAMEKGQTTIASAIAADKQVLRDITQREELTKAKTLKEIKAFWPKILEG